MKIRRKFAISNILMLAIPIGLIGIITVVIMVFFTAVIPIADIPFRDYRIFLEKYPMAIKFMFLWGGLALSIVAVTVTIVTMRLSKSIRTPINELRDAVGNITDGNLDFEVFGSNYEEINALCVSFDDMRRELKSAREREEEMKRERSMLIANISHDLKTPVTSIKGYIEGIKDGIADTPEKMEKYLDTIYAKAILVDEMISNLSAFSKLELSKIVFSFVRGDIVDFIRELAGEYRIDVERHGMVFDVNLPENSIYVQMDYEQLHRVFANLIDNAVKYKREGIGHIDISIEENEKGVFVRVCDAGIGIKENELNSVFDEFYRVDAARNPKIKGSGLGLGIAKQIVEKHGGKIWLRNMEPGTMAVVYLPKCK